MTLMMSENNDDDKANEDDDDRENSGEADWWATFYKRILMTRRKWLIQSWQSATTVAMKNKRNWCYLTQSTSRCSRRDKYVSLRCSLTKGYLSHLSRASRNIYQVVKCDPPALRWFAKFLHVDVQLFCAICHACGVTHKHGVMILEEDLCGGDFKTLPTINLVKPLIDVSDQRYSSQLSQFIIHLSCNLWKSNLNLTARSSSLSQAVTYKRFWPMKYMSLCAWTTTMRGW